MMQVWTKDSVEYPDKVTGAMDNEFPNYPIIENVDNPNVTIMTYLTDDPKIKIVWLFED